MGEHEALEHSWPLEGFWAPTREMVEHRPTYIGEAEVGRIASGGIFRDEIEQAVTESWSMILPEYEAINKAFPDGRRLGLDNLATWRFTAPTLAHICERLNVGPRHAITYGAPDEDHETTPCEAAG